MAVTVGCRARQAPMEACLMMFLSAVRFNFRDDSEDDGQNGVDGRVGLRRW